MLLVTLGAPLVTFLIIFARGWRIGTYGSIFVSCINIFLVWIYSLVHFINNGAITSLVVLWSWFEVYNCNVEMSFQLNGITSIMLIVVSTISLVVHAYSAVYMYLDPFLSKFMAYLSLFTLFMLLLTISANMLVLFLGWEGVGLCSYLLIGFWTTRLSAGKAATKAFLVNKIGDLFLLTGIAIIFSSLHSLDFAVINTLLPWANNDLLNLIVLFLFIGAVGKSAQIGLHTWLPDAMEGPTPVSALIHAATMVTAGVFLILRCSFFFEYAPGVMFLIAAWGGVTALVSGTIGSVQNDIKKVVAYSTCSQLGYMVLSAGLSIYSVSLFHLFNHAFFKALLFLSAGTIIHTLGGEQDIRKMGSTLKLSPVIYVNFLFASLAITGFPFLSGFYSKDIIIEAGSTKLWFGGQYIYWIVIVSASLTAFYSFRLIFIVFVKDFSGFKSAIYNRLSLSGVEFIALSLLGLLSLFSGFLAKDLFFGFGSTFFSNSFNNLPSATIPIDLELIPVFAKILPVLFSVVGILVFWWSYGGVPSFQKLSLETCKWYYNEFINFYLVLNVARIGRHTFEQYEKRTLELHGPILVASIILKPLYWR